MLSAPRAAETAEAIDPADLWLKTTLEPKMNQQEGTMLKTWTRIRNHFAAEAGATMVEYAFLLLLIAVVAIAVITQVGGTASEAFSRADGGFK